MKPSTMVMFARSLTWGLTVILPCPGGPLIVLSTVGLLPRPPMVVQRVSFFFCAQCNMEQTSIFYDDQGYEQRTLFPGEYQTSMQAPAQECPGQSTFCRGWGVGATEVEASNHLRTQATRLNSLDFPSTELYGTAPYMSQGVHDPEASNALRFGDGPRTSQLARGDLSTVDFTGYTFYSLQQCPLPRVEPGQRGGASTRADLRNAMACHGSS